MALLRFTRKASSSMGWLGDAPPHQTSEADEGSRTTRLSLGLLPTVREEEV